MVRIITYWYRAWQMAKGGMQRAATVRTVKKKTTVRNLAII